MNKRKMISMVLFSSVLLIILTACKSTNDIADIDMLIEKESVAGIDELPIEYISADFAIDRYR